MVDQDVVSVVRRYLGVLPEFGIHASRAVLFGSFAVDKADEWSDIDLIAIAPEFDEPYDITFVERLWSARITDSRIEPIPCGEREWETDGGRPILEVARIEGITIAA